MKEAGTLLDTLLAPPPAGSAGLQGGEATTLVVAAFGAVVLYFLARSRPLPDFPRMYAAIAFLGASWGASVLEGFAWAGLLDLAEHLALALSGLCFALSLYELGHPRFRAGGPSPRGGDAGKEGP